MLHLALETSSRVGSVALLDQANVLDEQQLPSDQRTAQSLFPVLDQMLQRQGRKPSEIKLISVTHGPGSFTGLRLGVACAKTLAYCLPARLTAVETLCVIAAQSNESTRPVVAVIDAQRGQLFVQRFSSTAVGPQPLGPIEIVDRADFPASVASDDVLIGPGLGLVDRSALADQIVISDSTLWQPRAETVGKLGAMQAAQGQLVSCWELLPNYGRPSAAEEKIR